MTPCTLSPETYRWQHNGEPRTVKIVMVGKIEVAWGEMVQVHDALAESPGLSFVKWCELEVYERGE